MFNCLPLAAGTQVLGSPAGPEPPEAGMQWQALTDSEATLCLTLGHLALLGKQVKNQGLEFSLPARATGIGGKQEGFLFN